MVPLQFDLAEGTVSGKPILGLTEPQVRAALGRPDSVEHFPVRIDLVYGPREARRVEVIITHTAWALEFGSTDDVEAKLGRVLTVPPRVLQARIARVYANAFRLVRSYRCDVKGCFGLFYSSDGERRIIFGVAYGKRYVGLQLRNPPPP
jgi:hypothetical protein